MDSHALYLVCSLKAYKLGKRRWSYNQCQLIVQQEDGDEQLNVMEAMANGNDSIQGEYQVRAAACCALRPVAWWMP